VVVCTLLRFNSAQAVLATYLPCDVLGSIEPVNTVTQNRMLPLVVPGFQHSRMRLRIPAKASVSLTTLNMLAATPFATADLEFYSGGSSQARSERNTASLRLLTAW
jgi:hypothetical protein